MLRLHARAANRAICMPLHAWPALHLAGDFCYNTADSYTGKESFSLTLSPAGVALILFTPAGSVKVACTFSELKAQVKLGQVGGSGSWK